MQTRIHNLCVEAVQNSNTRFYFNPENGGDINISGKPVTTYIATRVTTQQTAVDITLNSYCFTPHIKPDHTALLLQRIDMLGKVYRG